MVTDDSQSLDEYILQIFEEQEELFYFPVTSQKTARNFVKALHNKGLPYERVYKEIDEFEHNFTAWRKGLGRIGIGSRIIERINRPLQDVLVSDDEDDIQEILARLKEKNQASDENSRVPQIARSEESSQLQRIKDNIQKRGSQEVAPSVAKSREGRERDVEDSWRQCIEEKMKALEKKEENGNPARSPQLSRSSSGHVAGGELEQKQPGLVDFRSVLKRHVENDKIQIGGRDRRSTPPSFSLEGDGDGRSRLSTSLDRIHQIDNAGTKTRLNGHEERSKIRAESEPRLAQHQEEGKKTKEAMAESQKVAPTQIVGHTKDMHRDERRELEDKSNDEEFVDAVDLNQEPLPPEVSKGEEVKRSAPLAESESDSSSLESENRSESEETEGSSQAQDDKKESSESSEVSDNSDDDETDETGETDKTEESDYLDEIYEDYDSEWDEDNKELSAEGRKLAAQLVEYKALVSSSDGAGFVYVFSDSSEKTTMPRIKIGASRFPKKRLSQALHHNINMRQLAAYRANFRKKLAKNVCRGLAMYEIEGQDGWYQGPLADMMDIIETITAQSSQC